MQKFQINHPEKVHNKLNEWLTELVSRDGIKHAIIGLESGDRHFKWIGAKGDARESGVPIQGHTPFFIASVTKLFIAAAIFRLYEQQRIDLTDPITKILPEAITKGLHYYKGRDYSDKITVRHLLSHTSGLPDWLEDRPKKEKSLLETIDRIEEWHITIKDTAEYVRDHLTPHFAPQPFKKKRPKVRYSDTNFQLLIAIIEEVTEKPIYRAFEELVYQKIGLIDTFHPGHQASDQLELPADFWVDHQAFTKTLLLQSFRDLYSTADELLVFMKGLIRGRIFDDPQTAGLMQQQWNSFGFPTDAVALRLPSWPIEYGLGIMRFKIPRILTPFNPVPAIIGHTGVTGSWLFYCPELDFYLCGSVSQTSQTRLPYQLVPKILQYLQKEA